ncbi:hypothetical protein DB346_10010 [Verrucomicrobia bacterium LW23]|nr:hypothetical protein DB346_10010 [Verrucomicrobia bacterium LW23]
MRSSTSLPMLTLARALPLFAGLAALLLLISTLTPAAAAPEPPTFGAERKRGEWSIVLRQGRLTIRHFPEGQKDSDFELAILPGDRQKLEAALDKADQWKGIAGSIKAEPFSKKLPNIKIGEGYTSAEVTFSWSVRKDGSTAAGIAFSDGSGTRSGSGRIEMFREALKMLDLVPEMEWEIKERTDKWMRQDAMFN